MLLPNAGHRRREKMEAKGVEKEFRRQSAAAEAQTAESLWC